MRNKGMQMMLKFFERIIDKVISKNLFTESAALSFYFALSLVPLITVTLFILSLLGPTILETFSQQITVMLGKGGSDVILNIISSSKGSLWPKSVSIFGPIVWFVSAASVFYKLRETLSNIFDYVPEKLSTPKEIIALIKEKILSVFLMLGLICIVGVSLIASIALSVMFSKEITGSFSEILNQLITFVLYSLIFSLVFHFGPHARLPRYNALVGGVFASLGFLFGKFLISEYLTSDYVGSYGLAGSFIALLGFVYYSSFIFYVSAVITATIPPLSKRKESKKEMETRRRKRIKIFLVIFLGLVVFRAALPILIKNYLNNYMAHKIEGYTGHIGDFDLSLYRGAYQVEEFTFKKKNGNEQIPFINIKHADISLSWSALFKGRILLDLDIENSRIDFLDSKKKDQRQFGVEENSQNWVDVYEKIVPFSLQSLKLSNSEIHFQNADTKPAVDIFLNKINLEASNINNIQKGSKALFSSYKISSLIQNQGELNSQGTFNILSKPMAFDVNLKIEKVKLTELNPFFLAYGPVDVTSGTFNFYTEVATKDNKVAGYVKPVLEKVDVISGKENISSLKRFGFEFGTAFLNLFFRDGKTLSVASKIPITGDINKPDFGLWEGFKSALGNAFGGEKSKVKKKIDHTINEKDVKKK